MKDSRKAICSEVTPRQQAMFSKPSQKLFPEASLLPDSSGGAARFGVYLTLAGNRAVAGEGCSPRSEELLWVHVCVGRRVLGVGVAASSADSFTVLSLVQKRRICKLLLLLSLANRSPLETSL